MVKVVKDNPKNKQFAKEKDLQTHITKNIKRFFSDVVGDEMIYFETEKNIHEQETRSPRPSRVDIYVSCKKNDYILELKNPKGKTENTAGIGQLLKYATMIEKDVKLLLITTMFDNELGRAIEKFKLPIRYFYIDKESAYEYKGEVM
jgi:hypothetical protein